MLRYAKDQVGKPFSRVAMARALLFPRETNEQDWCAYTRCSPARVRDFRPRASLLLWCRRYCAELVAAVLKRGGLMDQASNPGAATPESLHAMYAKDAATTGNPTLLRDVTTLNSLRGVVASVSSSQERELLLAKQHMSARSLQQKMVGNLHVVATRQNAVSQTGAAQVTLTLNSLDMRKSLSTHT